MRYCSVLTLRLFGLDLIDHQRLSAKKRAKVRQKSGMCKLFRKKDKNACDLMQKMGFSYRTKRTLYPESRLDPSLRSTLTELKNR